MAERKALTSPEPGNRVEAITLAQVCAKIEDAVFSGRTNDRDFYGFLVVFAEENGLDLWDLVPFVLHFRKVFKEAWKKFDYFERLFKQEDRWAYESDKR